MSTPHRHTILLVEDDPDCRDTVGAILRDAEYEVVSFGRGDEALGHLRTAPAPCLLLLDLMMPGISGFELRAEQLRDPRLSAVPVVVLSAAYLPGGAADLGLQPDGFLPKPFHLGDVLATVRQHTKACPHARG